MSYSRKPYEPTISRRKLRNLTPITEKNIGTVMGHLSKFFSKPTVFLNGFFQKVIGEETKEYGDYTYSHKIYSDEYYPNYIPFEGECKIHYLWKKYLNGETYPWENPIEIPRLAIVSKYRTGCFPISIGDSYKLYGDRLVIMHKWDNFVHRTPWLRFTEFIHVESHDENKLKSIRVSGCISDITECMYEFREPLEFKLHGIWGKDLFIDFVDDLTHAVSDCIERILWEKSDLDEFYDIISLDEEDYLEVIIYPKKALDPNNREEFCKFVNLKNKEEYNSLYSAVNSIIDPMIEDWRKNNEIEEDDDADLYWDLDYDEF